MNETLNGPKRREKKGFFLPKVLKKHLLDIRLLPSRGLMVGRTPG